MSEEQQAGAAAGAEGAAGAVAGAGAAAAGATSGPEWLGSLSEDLRSDATLARYQSIEDLARGHVEAHKLAKSKAVPLPGDTDESRKAFADALRQQSVDAYDFGDVPETMDKGLVDGFREWAFAEGVPPHWAKGVVDHYAGAMQQRVDAANQASLADVDGFKKDYGSGFDAKVAQVRQMLEDFTGTALELTDEDRNRFDIRLGSSTLLKYMFAVHDRIGDLAPAGEGAAAAGVASVAPANANATFDAKMKDAEWRKKALTPGTQEHRESQHLQKMIAQDRVSRQNKG